MRRLYYVACVRVERCYGGSEEGGWWYDIYEVLEQHRVQSCRVEYMKDKLMKKHGPSPRPDRFSVLGTYDIECWASDEFLYSNLHRPRYE